jgi:hypothetical protein
MRRPRTQKIIALTLIVLFAAGAALGVDMVSGGAITDHFDLCPYQWIDLIPFDVN